MGTDLKLLQTQSSKKRESTVLRVLKINPAAAEGFDLEEFSVVQFGLKFRNRGSKKKAPLGAVELIRKNQKNKSNKKSGQIRII